MNSSAPRPHRTIGLRTRTIASLVLLSIITLAAALSVSYYNLRQELRQALKQRLLNIVTLAAMQQDGDAFLRIQSDSDPEFIESYTRNTAILNSDPDLAYLYTMRYDDQGIYFVADAGDPNDPGHADYGTRYEEPGPVLEANYRNLQEPITEEDFYTDEFGTFLTAYAPIRDSNGNVIGIIGVDIRAEKVLEGERRLLVGSLLLYALILPVVILGGVVMADILSRPVRALTQMAEHFRSGDLAYRLPVKSRIPEIRTLQETIEGMANQLQSLIRGLEERVEERTRDLRAANEQVQRRVVQLQTIHEVGSAILLIQDIDRLLIAITRLISERFGFYHVGVFLADEKNEYVVLRASNSEGGARMLARGHRLKIGKEGIVGYVAERGKPRIALDVGIDAVYFSNPDLPETRSEMALPLMVRERVIGVLDIQSRETNAFKEEDFAIFSTLANQVAIAIENARLLDETRRTLAESERLYGQFVQQGWRSLLDSEKILGIRHDPQGSEWLSKVVLYPEIKQALQSGEMVVKTGKNSVLALPLSIRGQTIAVLNIRLAKEKRWTNAEINTLQRIADRAALALENARLVKSTQLSAQKERIISEISAKISASVNIRNVLQTALEELGRVLPNSQIEIQLENLPSTQEG